MLIIRFRHLSDLSYDAEKGAYHGRATIGYSFADDPDITHRATLHASTEKARQARFSWVEQAVLDAATRKLIERFAELDEAPENIFALPGALPRARAA